MNVPPYIAAIIADIKLQYPQGLPACPHCGAPENMKIVGGYICINNAGKPCAPHAARLKLAKQQQSR